MALPTQQPTAGASDFVLDIPALDPVRDKMRVADHIIEIRSTDEISIRNIAKLINMLRNVDLGKLQHHSHLMDDEEFTIVFTALSLIFDIAYITDGEPGIPDHVLEKIREVDQIVIAMEFVNRFFGARQTATPTEPGSLEEELDQIVGLTGVVKSQDSDTGSEEV